MNSSGQIAIQMFPQAAAAPKTKRWQGKEIDTDETTVEIRAAK